MAWNERTLMDHQYRRRGQVQAMSLMLQVLKLHTLKARIELLRKTSSSFVNPKILHILSFPRESLNVYLHGYPHELSFLGAPEIGMSVLIARIWFIAA